MFARMATFTVNDPDRAIEMGGRVRAVIEPLTAQLPGWQGATQMIDRAGGKLVVMHVFDTQENMDAAESTFETMPQHFDDDLRQFVQQVASGRQSVEKFEILAERRNS